MHFGGGGGGRAEETAKSDGGFAPEHEKQQKVMEGLLWSLKKGRCQREVRAPEMGEVGRGREGKGWFQHGGGTYGCSGRRKVVAKRQVLAWTRASRSTAEPITKGWFHHGGAARGCIRAESEAPKGGPKMNHFGSFFGFLHGGTTP